MNGVEIMSEMFRATSKKNDQTKPDTDSDEKFKLSLAFQNLSAYTDRLLPFDGYIKSTVLILDLTENNFTGLDDLKFLFEFTRLKTLILDKNQVQSNIRIPFLPSLLTLWVNHNQIENLAIFVENVASACPNLTYLSMMNNRAAPSYFNGGSLAEYNDYRFYTISKLVDLKMLDDRQITPEERLQSKAIYGTGRLARHTDMRKMSLQPGGKIKKMSITPSIDDESVDRMNKQRTRRSSKRANSMIVKSSSSSSIGLDDSDNNQMNNSKETNHLTLSVSDFESRSILEEIDLPSVGDSNNNLRSEVESDIQNDALMLNDSVTAEEAFEAATSLMLAEALPDVVEAGDEEKGPPSPALALLVDLDSLPDVEQD